MINLLDQALFEMARTNDKNTHTVRWHQVVRSKFQVKRRISLQNEVAKTAKNGQWLEAYVLCILHKLFDAIIWCVCPRNLSQIRCLPKTALFWRRSLRHFVGFFRPVLSGRKVRFVWCCCCWNWWKKFSSWPSQICCIFVPKNCKEEISGRFSRIFVQKWKKCRFVIDASAAAIGPEKVWSCVFFVLNHQADFTCESEQ